MRSVMYSRLSNFGNYSQYIYFFFSLEGIKNEKVNEFSLQYFFKVAWKTINISRRSVKLFI